MRPVGGGGGAAARGGRRARRLQGARQPPAHPLGRGVDRAEPRVPRPLKQDRHPDPDRDEEGGRPAQLALPLGDRPRALAHERGHHRRLVPPRQPRVALARHQLGKVLRDRHARRHPPRPRQAGALAAGAVPAAGGHVRLAVLGGRRPLRTRHHPREPRPLHPRLPARRAAQRRHQRGRAAWLRAGDRHLDDGLRGRGPLRGAQGRPLQRLGRGGRGGRPRDGTAHARLGVAKGD
mmetsp:Transcript_26742/g.88045  ORF Transcript_26742/g.88045 Transcript_26742/m.88045 type:complete len:235 (-) Transcript_26742:1884-2588(-)